MRKIYFILSSLLATIAVNAQEDSTKPKELSEAIVTGQYKPQSIKNSVYQVRVIGRQRIELSGASNIQQVLNSQLGFRFSNDNTLGVSDITLMGMSGRNVKILLDGIPLVDRGDTRESLNQVDINSIDRIEIVEGPMSVIYGSDALAGVINIITKKNALKKFRVTARAQEETVGDEYYPFSYKGNHLQHAGIQFQQNAWNFSVAGTHNDFDGFGGDEWGRAKTWRPKEQWFGNGKIGYKKDGLDIYFRSDALNEEISDRGAINTSNYKAIDKYYTTHRYMQQLQGNYRINNDWLISGLAAYTDYSRKTKTLRHDFENNTEQLTTGEGEQDLSRFKSFVMRGMVSWQVNAKMTVQPGVDVNYEKASGDRISGQPAITDLALFITSEIKPVSWINIRPGLRFIHNSVYDAPPVIPSLNTKFNLSKAVDLRVSYAYGFRSPALRELYFFFHDANHDINGNPNLKAEHSNSFNASLSWMPAVNAVKTNITVGGFYNDFRNQVDLAQGTDNAGNLVYSYFNINRSKTVGVSVEDKMSWKKLDATIGFTYTGYSSTIYDDNNFIKEDDKDFLWTPEVNAGFVYALSKLKTRIAFFYKYTGKKSAFNLGTNSSGQDVVYISEAAAYHLADLTIDRSICKHINLNAGVKNIFDVTNIRNTAASSAHNSGGPQPISYGRSYFLGLTISK